MPTNASTGNDYLCISRHADFLCVTLLKQIIRKFLIIIVIPLQPFFFLMWAKHSNMIAGSHLPVILLALTPSWPISGLFQGTPGMEQVREGKRARTASTG